MSDSDSNQIPEWQPSQPRKRSALPGTGDLSRRLMDDMDPEVLEFLKTTVNSFIKWDLVIFFFENPHTTDTIDNVARYIGRDSTVIRRSGRRSGRCWATFQRYVDGLFADQRCPGAGKDQAFCIGQR
jgi:hypothetical protein